MTRHGDPGSINPYRSPRRSPKGASMRSNAAKRPRCIVHDVVTLPSLEFDGVVCLLCLKATGRPDPRSSRS